MEIAKINSIDGKFFAKDPNGNVRELNVGDLIYEGEIVFGDKSNSDSDNIVVNLYNDVTATIKADNEQAFDATMTATAHGDEEMSFSHEVMDSLLRAGDEVNVVSDLRDAKFESEEIDTEDEGKNNDDDSKEVVQGEDILDEDTAEGEETLEEGQLNLNFQFRDGNSVNVISDLRKKEFVNRSQDYKEEELFKHESEDRLDNQYDGTRYTSLEPIPPSTQPPVNTVVPPVAPPVVTTPPVIIGNLSIDDVTVYENDGYLVFTVSLDREVASDVIITYITADITATKSKDYEQSTGTVTIPQGSLSVTVKVPVIDDYVSDNGETMKVIITNVDGNAQIIKPEGIGTILDNPINNPENGTSNTPTELGGYGEEDTVYAIITGDTSVNEGDSADYKVKLIDKDGNSIIVTENTDVTVIYTNTTTQDGDTEYDNNTSITVTIPSGSSEAFLDVDTIDDYIADNGENYNVAIKNVDTNEFENVVIGDKDGNNKDVTTTILDNSNSTDQNTPHDPNNLQNHTQEADKEIVSIKLFAADKDGNVLKDGSGNYLQANEVYEGEDANYIAYAFEEGENSFNDSTRLDIQIGTVNISFHNGSAIGGNMDFNSAPQTSVTIGQAFNTNTLLDTTAEGSENYTVTIDDNSYSGNYESVEIDTSPVTTILKDAKLFVKIEAIDNEANESENLTYKISIVNSAGNPVEVPAGKDLTVNLNYEGNTSNPATHGDDYTSIAPVTISSGNSNTILTIPTIDDYYAEGEEGLKITIDSIDNSSNAFEEIYTHTLVNGAPSDKITTTGTIKDNPANIDKPTDENNTDDPTEPNGSYDQDDTIYAIIEGPANVNEGDTTTVYTVKLIDKNGDLVTVTQETNVTVTYTNDTTEDDDTEYNNSDTITVTISANSSSKTFTVDTLDDPYKDDGEIYNLEITNVENTGEFENVKIGDKDGNHKDVDTTINDDTNSNTETDIDAVKIVLVAVSSTTTTIADITNPDGTLNITNTNSTPESGKLYYMAVAVDSDGKPLSTQDGTVDISYGTTTDGTDKDATAGIDYDDTTVTNVTIGQVFEVQTDDDYFAEGDENFTVKITNQSGTSYESPSIDTSNDTVTSTIQDNPAKTKQPDNSTNPDDPTNGSYDEDDTVYVKITDNASEIEGNDLTHTVSLVDKDDNPITVPNGETITVTITYNPDQTASADFTQAKTTIVTITGGNSSATITHSSIDDFNAEGNESYTATITDVAQTNGTYENLTIDTNNDSVIGEIIDGVSLGVPDNAQVDEDNFDMENSVTTITDTQSLNITAPNGDNGYNLLFDNMVTAKDPDTDAVIALTSNGQNISFDYTVDGKITATRDGDSKKVFEITLNKNGAGGANDSYTYTQYENIDHPDANVDDDIVLTFGYKITDQGQTSSVQNFTVTVNDSLPSSVDQSITLNEDTTQIIYISDESFANGNITLNNGVDGNQVIAKDGTLNIYDNTIDQNIVGVITNNGDGTLTFEPNEHFSGVSAGFSYDVSDGDGDSATGNIGITVNPIADKPDMNGATAGTESATIITTPQVKEDNNNNAAEEGATDYTTTIGLILPQITDSNDYTGDTTNDDQPEKLGLITLSSATGSTIIANGTEYDLGSGSIKIYITDDPINYHYSGIDTTDAVSLTQAQFEAIVVKFEKDNADNPEFTVTVDEYEVNDDNTIDGTVTKATNSQDYEVDILAVTDPITLAWDANGGLGTIDSATDFTFTTVNEGFGTIDLKSLLTKTSGLETDPDGDLDGSEERSYTISGIPEGTIVTLDGRSVAAGSDGTATIKFPDNTADDPDFTITIAEQFSGTINGTITLNVTDTDNDSTGAISTQSASVDFTMNVNPVADQVTLKVAQAQGSEDAGRTNSNDENSSANTIDAAENGIELYINVISDDNKDISGAVATDEKEQYNVTIDGIPDGGSLYVYDNSASIWKLINETDAGTSGDLVIVNNGDNTWKVTINDYQNDQLPKFIPPYNSDDNYTFDISAESFDNPDTSIAQTLQIDVTVDEIADIPVNDDLTTTTATDDDNDSNSFNLVSTEDSGGINIKGIFATPATLDSNDLSTADGSETLTFKVTGLASGFGIDGATFIGGSGEDRIWLVDVNEMNNDNVTLTTPTHFAGQVDFQVQFVTTEAAGDSKTHPIKDISVMITPDAEGTINIGDTQNEDEAKVLDFGFSSPDIHGADAGQESLESFSIDMSTVPAGVTLTGSVSGVLNGVGHVALDVTNGVLETVTATLTEDIDTDYSFNISYTINDVAVDSDGNTYTDTKTVTDQAYNVTVNAITDDINLDMSTTTGANNSVDGSGHVTVTDNGTFTKTLTVSGIDSDGRGSADTDSSEEFTRVTVSGVPEGITIQDGVYAGDTGGGNYSGFWYVDIPNQALDADGATYDLVFDVDGSFDANDLGDYNITVTAYNQEQNNDVEQSDSESFTLTIDTEITGPGPGTPAVITAFYQDIDNDSTHDHTYTVSTVADTTITDADAYQGSVVREDVQFQLSDVVYVETDTTGATSTAFSITLKNVPADVDIEGMTLNANGFYTLSGSGNQAAIVSKLQEILITPKSNANTDSNDISNSDLNFDIELTTYANGGASNFALINFSASVLPVTDEMDLTVVNDGTTDEDVAQTFSITLDNQADGAKTTIIDGKVYLKLTETYSDTVGSDGTNGTLSYNGSVITTTAISGISGIADGDYYVITGVSYNDTFDFSFLPAENRDGTITIDTYVNNQENESWNPYDTDIITSHKQFSFSINAVEDGFTLGAGANINGNEDELALVDISLTSTDSSEKLSSVSLSGLPDGFLLFYGEQANASDKALANNLGTSGNVDIEMTYGVSENVDTNTWNIPLNNDQLPSYIWIQTPENWSGTIPDLSVIAVDENGNIFPETITAGTITPVVDNLTLNATQTFGKEGEDILLNLNANVQDLDGSETVTLTLSGFGDGDATFKANGEAISHTYAGDTYTIEGISVHNINALTVTHEAMSTTTITATAKMVESDGTESALVNTNNTFDIKISQSIASSGNDTLLLKDGISFDGLDGTDTLVANGKTLDASKISNIEILDLNAADNSISLTLDEVLVMTDSDNEIVIIGDSSDSIGVDTTGWTQGSTVDNGDDTTYTYSKGSDTVKLTVDDDIPLSGL